MKAVGRIIMVIVGAVLLYFAITNGINAYRIIRDFHWEGFAIFLESLPSYLVIIKCLIYAFCSCAAFVAAIIGRGSIRYFVYALLMAILAGYQIFISYRHGTLGAANTLGIVVGFVMPFMYVVGSIILLFASAKD